MGLSLDGHVVSIGEFYLVTVFLRVCREMVKAMEERILAIITKEPSGMTGRRIARLVGEPIPQVSQAEETQPVAMRQEHQFQFSASLTLPTMTFDAPPPAKLGLPSLDRSLPALSAASLSAPTTWAVPTYTLPQIP